MKGRCHLNAFKIFVQTKERKWEGRRWAGISGEVLGNAEDIGKRGRERWIWNVICVRFD